MRLRRGLLSDVQTVFDYAEDMCGGIFPPEEIATQQEAVRRLRREVLALLRLLKRKP